MRIPFISREKRIIYSRKIKGFWEEYRRNRVGIIGLSLLILYVILAIISPWITPYNPEKDFHLAESYAMPEWIAYIVPGARDLPRTTRIFYDITPVEPLSQYVTFTPQEQEWRMVYNGSEPVRQEFIMASFDYPYKAANEFTLDFGWSVHPAKSGTVAYSVEIQLQTPKRVYSLWDHTVASGKYGDPDNIPLVIWPDGAEREYVTPFAIAERIGYGGDHYKQMVQDLLSEKGEYELMLILTFQPLSEESAVCDVEVMAGGGAAERPYHFYIRGVVHGLLGTNHQGADVFSEFLLGIRISLMIGLIAGVIATSLGVLIGIISGYLGGFVDESLMRLVDILLCLPILPILLVLITLFGANVWYIILIIGVFWWLGLARLIMSQVLALREMPFVESAIASGASGPYIMIRHLVPNVMPLALADFVLTVPGAILLEAALSFIGFGDPLTPTWGRMLQTAWTYGAFRIGAWWYFVPPGLAITLLCITFVFIGHAVDEIVNPRLRRRR